MTDAEKLNNARREFLRWRDMMTEDRSYATRGHEDAPNHIPLLETNLISLRRDEAVMLREWIQRVAQALDCTGSQVPFTH
jgi:hypothetical protein